MSPLGDDFAVPRTPGPGDQRRCYASLSYGRFEFYVLTVNSVDSTLVKVLTTAIDIKAIRFQQVR